MKNYHTHFSRLLSCRTWMSLAGRSIAFASAFAFLSCDKDPITPIDPTQINLQAPVVGQHNFYLKYEGLCGEVVPTGDTLKVEVVWFDGLELQLSESLTPGSPGFQNNPYPFVYGTVWNENVVEMTQDIRQQSALFFFYGSDSLRLQQPFSVDLLQQNCLLWDGNTDFVGDQVGKVNSFTVGNETFHQKRIVSCVPPFYDLKAYLVYDKNNLYSSYVVYDDFSGDLFVRAYALME